MDTASQLVYRGIDPLLRSSHSHRHKNLSLRRRSNRVSAVATDPKPAPVKTVNGSSSKSPSTIPVNGVSQRIGDVSKEIKRVRAQMEEDEQLATLMRGLRGQNLSDSLFAEDDVQLRLVEVDESSEFLPLVYEPASITAYWGKRPRSVATRIVQLLSVAGGFLSRVAWDVVNKKVKENEVARAIEIREIVTSLGPAYIKLGQALSIRPDILSPAAMTELQKLCDKVPSFADDVAMALIEEELGQPWQNFYSELSPSPIAAASLGQVYKGRLKENGDLVAVKVQRPFVLETVTIDLFIIRNLGLALRKFPQISIDVVGLVDEWAARFFEELDYVNEGENGNRFAEMMKKDLPQVVIPRTYSKYTSRRVLTTEWIDGEKLSQSKESNVGELVNVGVICYLKQLLDTGFFHADPHPGNMIRTPDGKLAILDFGLVTKLTDDQKYGMIEAIAHLIHRDYTAIVKDFVKLGFIPDGVNLEPILPVLAKVFDQALEGGGAKNINFQDLASDLAQITFDYPFRIPPYFALIIRAIGVLEGIALVGNPDFAIVDEAYPYIAQRLLTDESPRLRSALRYTIYGKSGVFDAERFIDVMQAFERTDAITLPLKTTMAYGRLSLLLTKRRLFLYSLNPKTPFLRSHLFSTSQNPNPKPSSLSARLSFVFDQIDAIEKERSQKHETLQRIRAWRDSKNSQNEIAEPVSEPITTSSSNEEAKMNSEPVELVKKEVELVHPWPEWIQLMERLVHQNYFDHRRKDEDKMVQDLGFDTPEDVHEEGLDFTKDFKSVHAACLNFGKDRFDLLRSLSRQDIQVLVGFGCPNGDRKVVFSGKLLRKLVHLDEGDVCSSCSLRNNCDNAYLLTNKEDEARTIDIMRMLLTFGFDPINGSVTNKPLLKHKSVKAVVRKLLHEVVKLSSVPIDPNLPPPVIKKPPPKVKQPPPTPKRRVGRDDVEMKRGDWLCPKCDFMNFAKNNVCLQCDAKRPKRQLLPGEWECTECNFLNYRRNVVCFHCECKRPPEEFLENKIQDNKYSSGPNFNKTGSRQEVSNAWNFDFDDNESDGAEVAAFEYADSRGINKDFPSDNNDQRVGWEDDFEKNNRVPRSRDEEYVNPGPSRPRTGFDDFDDEDDIDSYELETQTEASSARSEATKNKFSETEDSLDWEDSEDIDDKMHAPHKTASGRIERTRSVRKNTSFSRSKDDELDYDSDEQRSILSNFKSSHVFGADQKRKGRGPTKKLSFGSESDEDGGAGLYSDEDDDLNDAYSSRQNKGIKRDPSRQNRGNRHDSGRRSFTEDRNSGGYKANMFSDSDDFDDSSRQSYRNDRGSQGSNRDRKRFDDFDGSSRKSYGNDRGSHGSNRDRKRFDDFDGSSRKSYGNDRGSQGNRKRFDDFDGSSRKSYGNERGSQGSNRDRKRFDDFDGSSRKSFGNDRGSQGSNRDRKKFDDFDGSPRKSYGNDRGSRGNGRSRQKFDDRERGRGQFNNYSMDEKGDGEFRNKRRVIER